LKEASSSFVVFSSLFFLVYTTYTHTHTGRL
jgi:hypothetical protein